MPDQLKAQFCPDCGTRRPTSASFCPGCGVALTSVDVDDTTGSPASPDIVSGVPVGQPVSPGRSTDARSRWLAVTAVVAAVALVVGGTVWFLARTTDDPALDALDRTRGTYADLISSLAEVKSIEDVAEVATQAQQAGDSLETANQEVRGGDGETAQQVTAVLTAELDNVRALAGLRGLSATSLTPWSEHSDDVRASVTAYVAAVSDLAAAEPSAAEQQPDTRQAWATASDVVSSGVVARSSQEATAALHLLSKVRTTADVRESAQKALQVKTILEASAAAVDEDTSSESSLTKVTAVLDALAPLSGLTVDDLDVWKEVRPSLVSALASVPAGSDDERPVGQAGDAALTRLDHVIEVADAAMREWRVNNASAITARQAAVEELDTYASQMRAQVRTYSTLRGDTADFIDRIESGAYITFDEGYAFLDQAQWNRRAVRDTMNGLGVPAAMQGQHAALVAVIDRAISAIQAADDGTYDAEWCTTTCYWKNTPGWRTFHTESMAISTEYASTLTAWETGIAEAQGAAAHLPLPPKPRV